MPEKKGRRLGAAGQAQHRGRATRGRSGFAVSIEARAGDGPDLGSYTDASRNGKENKEPFRRHTTTYKLAPRRAPPRLPGFASSCAEQPVLLWQIKADASSGSRNRKEIGATPAKKSSAPPTIWEGIGRSNAEQLAQRRNRMTMQRTIALVGLLALALIKVPSAVAAAGSVPTFDTHPTCADAATEFSMRTVERCQESEQQARDSLATQWSSFPTTDEANCTAETRIGGFPSYVQLLTCLEMAREARTLKPD